MDPITLVISFGLAVWILHVQKKCKRRNEITIEAVKAGFDALEADLNERLGPITKWPYDT